MLSIEDILAQVEPPEKSVTLCLKGSLVAQYERLEAELSGADRPSSLAGGDATAIAAQMEQVRAEMLRHEVAFTFRAWPAAEFEAFTRTRPKSDEDTEAFRAEYHLWSCAMVARSCADPAMTTDQANRLSQRLSMQQWRSLANAAFEVNAEAVSVPFSFAASALNQLSDAKSKQPETSESGAANSLASGSADSEPSLNGAAAASLAG